MSGRMPEIKVLHSFRHLLSLFDIAKQGDQGFEGHEVTRDCFLTNPLRAFGLHTGGFFVLLCLLLVTLPVLEEAAGNGRKYIPQHWLFRITTIVRMLLANKTKTFGKSYGI